jgi:hypothetical protein
MDLTEPEAHNASYDSVFIHVSTPERQLSEKGLRMRRSAQLLRVADGAASSHTIDPHDCFWFVLGWAARANVAKGPH